MLIGGAAMTLVGIAVLSVEGMRARGRAAGRPGGAGNVPTRMLLALAIGPAFGETAPHLPLYIAEALVVEGVALRIATDRRPLAYGVVSGVGIGTVGLAAEWGWSHVWMPLPWPAELFPEGALIGFAGAVAGGLLGAWIGARLSVEPARGERRLRTAAAAGAALLALLAWGLHRLSATAAERPPRGVRWGRAPQVVERPISAASPSSVRSSPNV